VENICHTLVGLVLARSGLGRLAPHATTTLVVASNLPDIDIISGLWGDLSYMEHHRGITHSLAAMPIEAAALAAVMWGAPRLRSRGDGMRVHSSFLRLFAVALVGLVGHLVLDWTNSYGVRPLLPLDEHWRFGDLVFVVDPWLWLVLGGALFLSATLQGRERIVWGGFWCMLSVFVCIGAASAPALRNVTILGWLPALAAIVATRRLRGASRPELLARVALAVLVAYWASFGLLHRIAYERIVRASAAEGIAPVVEVAALPTLMRADTWRGIVETNDSLYITEFSLIDSPDPLRFDELPRNIERPEVQRALATCAGRAAARFCRFLRADVDSSEDGETTVTLRDARFPVIVPRGVANIPIRVATPQMQGATVDKCGD